MSNKSAYNIKLNQTSFDIKDPITKSAAKKIRNALKLKTKAKFESDLELCKWLFWTQNAFVGSVPFWEDAGYPTWGEYTEGDLGITASEARKLALVHSVYAISYADKWDPKKHSLHISKLIALIPVLTEDNFEELLEQAKNISAEDFKTLTSTNSINGKQSVTYSYPKDKDKYREKAFKLARKMFGKDLTESGLFIEILKFFIEKASKK